MVHTYDLVIVGAGPGGAMAAKTAGENGLRTVLLERKTDPAAITRACAMMFAVESDYYFGERMFYNEQNRKMIFPVNGFTVDYHGPKRNFYALHFYAPDGKTRIEFGDYDKNIKKGEKGRLSFVYDKGILIGGLLQEAVNSGVDVRTGVNVTGIEKTANGVKVSGNGDCYEGTFVIGADGINSRIADIMGFNKHRRYYGPISAQTYYLTGFKKPRSEAAVLSICCRPDASFPSHFWVIPSPYAEDEYWMTAHSREKFDYFTKNSVFAHWFSDITVKRMRCAVADVRAPVADPYKDNVLLVGDSAWFVEAEITGSMMCGWKAANAVSVALRENKPNRQGVLDYSTWWKKSFPEFDDYRNFMMHLQFRAIFTEQEICYLYGLVESPLPASLNPFLTIRLIKKALEPLMPQIGKQMPAVAEKLSMLEAGKAEKVLSEINKVKRKNP